MLAEVVRDQELPVRAQPLRRVVKHDLAVREHVAAVRDLERGLSTGLPSGEAVARHLGEEPLTPREVGVAELGWEGETPLWYYVLKEAEVRCGGCHLGPVGGRLVAEVLPRTVIMDGGLIVADGPTDLILADVALLEAHGLEAP